MPKIKMSEIRDKFPMYGDLSDDQLVGALHRKFYSDIPIGKFTASIDYDTQRDALRNEVAGETNTVLAGIGQAFSNLGRGVGQAFGQVSRDDVAEQRNVDSALNATTGGKVGNVIGNVAALLPTALIPGVNTYTGAAALGAGLGALQPSESTAETLGNTALGGVAGAGGILLGRGLGAVGSGVRGLVEPFTKKGQERMAAGTLQAFASDPAKAAAALQAPSTLVKGSQPTMAQASGDAGLAQLERSLGNNPETGRLMSGRYQAQRSARLGAVQDVAGTDEYYNAIKAGRDVFAREDYGKAMIEGFDAEMSKVMKPQIAALMERPSIQQAKREAMTLAKEKNFAIKNWGSIEGLDWLKKGLDNLISSAKKPGSSIGDVKLRALVQTKQDLMSVIEEVAPAYKTANDNFAAMSRQVNSMDAARGLLDRMQSPLARFGADTRELKNEYARALEAATESVKKSTGMDRPLAAVMNSKDVATLNKVAEDMARAARAEDIGRAIGSNTAQNLAAQNLLRRMLGPMGMKQSWAESNVLQGILSPYSVLAKYGGADSALMERLAKAALDPQDAAGLLSMEATRRPITPMLLPVARTGLLGYAAE